jgi:hypothetical protein
MNRKSIWDKLSDLDLVEEALEELTGYPDDDSSMVSVRALLVQLKKRIQSRNKEGGK